MEQLTTRIGIEPGLGLVGRFGDTVIVIPRGGADTRPDDVAHELLELAAEVGSDRQAPANAIASRLAQWVIGHMSGEAPAFGIVAPMRDGVVMFLRGAVWCTITEGGATREVSGEQALTWVDLIVPGTFERLAIGGSAGRPVQADPLSDLMAREALRLLSANLQGACDEPGDLEAREKMLLGAHLAGVAFSNAPVAGVHRRSPTARPTSPGSHSAAATRRP